MSIFQRTYEDNERDWWHKVNAPYRRREDQKLRRARIARKIRRALKTLKGILS